MSLGIGVKDFVDLTTFVWGVIQNTRSALGAHNELTRDVTSLHIVLQTLEHELSKPESLLNRCENKNADRREQLAVLASDCRRVTGSLSRILKKYDAVPDAKGSARRLKQRVQFGNSEMKNLNEIKRRIGAIVLRTNFFISIITLGSQGRVEQLLESHRSDIPDMKELVFKMDLLLARQQDNTREESISSYADDDKMFWREFRKQFVEADYPSSKLKRNKTFMKDYIRVVSDSGVLDDRRYDTLPTLGEEVTYVHQTTIPDQQSPNRDESNLREVDNEVTNDAQKVDYLPRSAQKMDSMTNHTPGGKSNVSGYSAFHPHSAHHSEEIYHQNFRIPGVEPSIKTHREHKQADSGVDSSALGPTQAGSGNPFSASGPTYTDSSNPFSVPRVTRNGSGNPFPIPGATLISSGTPFSYTQPSSFPLYNGSLQDSSTGFIPIPNNFAAGIYYPGYQSTFGGASSSQSYGPGPFPNNMQPLNPNIPPLPRVEISEDIPWQRELIKKMKEPILWEELSTILRESGVPEIQNVVPWNGKVPNLPLDFCRRARALHGGTSAGTILLEPVKTKTKKKKGMFSTSGTRTTMRTWDPNFEPSKSLKPF